MHTSLLIMISEAMGECLWLSRAYCTPWLSRAKRFGPWVGLPCTELPCTRERVVLSAGNSCCPTPTCTTMPYVLQVSPGTTRQRIHCKCGPTLDGQSHYACCPWDLAWGNRPITVTNRHIRHSLSCCMQLVSSNVSHSGSVKFDWHSVLQRKEDTAATLYQLCVVPSNTCHAANQLLQRSTS